jgi:pimeloyl-ACP methyl ester carboxylesterase
VTTYVLVPGGCHGGWCFDDLAAGLRSRGHRVLALTLTGVAERAHLRHAGVNLETHVADVIAELEAHRVEQAVLVGHSYGGMVITAVADRAPERVDALVYIDAFVPNDGDSCWTLTTDDQRRWYADVDETGFGIQPLPFFDERATTHPLASLMQPIRLQRDLSRFRRRDFVYATKWEGESPFAATLERLRNDPSWNTHVLDGAHNLMRDNPDDLLRILLEAGAS